MSEFDLVFALVSLLVGLSIAELLGGFARVLRLKARQRAAAKGAVRVDPRDPGLHDAPAPETMAIRVGWLVPLLGAYILFDQLSFFTAAWAWRKEVPVNLFSLVAITVVVGGYYLVAALVFPEEPGDWPDFDRYYDEHNRMIVGFALFAQVAQLALNFVLRPDPDAGIRIQDAGVGTVVFALVLAFATFPLLIALWRAKTRRMNAALLVTLLVQHGVMAVVALWFAG